MTWASGRLLPGSRRASMYPPVTYPRGRPQRVRSGAHMQAKTRRVAVVGGNRIPFARSNTVYATASNQDMLTAAIDGLVARYGLQGERLGEVVAGAVLKHSRDFNLTRESVLGSRLAPETPAYDIQQACDTGIQAADAGGQQDRARPDRGRHRRRHRHHLRRPDRRRREAPQDPARGQPRQVAAGPAGRAGQGPPAAPRRRRSRRTASRAPGCRWGSPPRSPRSSGRSAARSRTSSPSPRTRTSPRRTTGASSTTWSRRSRASSATRTSAPTPRWRSSPRSSRCSARARPRR